MQFASILLYDNEKLSRSRKQKTLYINRG